MIQKRNISNFAIGLCLLALMLLSASPAKAFKTTDPNMRAAYDSCLANINSKSTIKEIKKCFEDFRTTYASACLVTRNGVEEELAFMQLTSRGDKFIDYVMCVKRDEDGNIIDDGFLTHSLGGDYQGE
jgi:hypothetical protein